MTLSPQVHAAPHPQPQPARATAAQPAVTPAPVDVIAEVKQRDEAVINSMASNAVYKLTFNGTQTKEKRIDAIVDYLAKGLRDGAASADDWAKYRRELTALNTAIQTLNRRLGAEQAVQITSSMQADYQRILTMSAEDTADFEDRLAVPVRLAELFEKFGADGNIIVKLNDAKTQKAAREARLKKWWETHAADLATAQRTETDLQREIGQERIRLSQAWMGKAGIQANIENLSASLIEAERETKRIAAMQPEIVVDTGDVPPADESILDLQNLGGEKFQKLMIDLRETTETNMAKMSINFDKVVVGLTASGEAFRTMERDRSDAILALSILDVAVKRVEAIAREVAEATVVAPKEGADDAMAALDRMEQEQRRSQILDYTTSLTTASKDIAFGVTALLKGQNVVKDILRSNALALESANMHKVTGMTNTANSVTIVLGGIIDTCTRAAGRALADAQSHIGATAEAASARLAGGSSEALQQQNVELTTFIGTVDSLRQMTLDITKESIGALREQYELVERMRTSAEQLSASTRDAEHAMFDAKAGVVPPKTAEEEAVQTDQPIRFRMGG